MKPPKTLLCIAVILMAIVAARADQPFRVSSSVTNGAATYTVAGVNNSLFFAQKPEAFIFPRPATTNATTYSAYYVVGTITNLIGTKTVTAGDSTLTPTNVPWLFTGDKLVFSTTESGTNTVYHVGQEK